MSDDDVRGGYPAGGHHPERNGGLRPGDSENIALPADLAAVQADDALLDALYGPNPSPEGSDARLTQVLMAWRHEVDTEPAIPLVDTDTALAMVARARRPEPRRSSVLVPFAAAAAVLVIAFSGVGVGAQAAEPGDRLWALAKVLNTELAQSEEAEDEVRAQLKEASEALEQGRTGAAQTALAQVEEELQVVDDEESRAELKGRAETLRSKLGGRPGTGDRPGPTPSRAQPTSTPDLPTSAAPSTPPEASQPGEPPVPSAAPEKPAPNPSTDPGPGTGGAGGENSEPAPRSGLPPRSAPPPPPAPVAPVPPESSPEG